MLWQRIQAQRRRGRAFQPRDAHRQVLASWIGGLLAITLLGAISSGSQHPLLVAPFGASTVLLFGQPGSPLAQPRNIVAGNTLAAMISVLCVAAFGQAPWVMGLAVGLTIALSQCCRCLHPPAGAVALLGVLHPTGPGFVFVPVLVGSLLLTLMAVLHSRLSPQSTPYPHHWL